MKDNAIYCNDPDLKVLNNIYLDPDNQQLIVIFNSNGILLLKYSGELIQKSIDLHTP